MNVFTGVVPAGASVVHGERVADVGRKPVAVCVHGVECECERQQRRHCSNDVVHLRSEVGETGNRSLRRLQRFGCN